MSTPEEIVDEIKRAKAKIKKAETIKCTCSSFVFQYEGGCQCDSGRAISLAESELRNIINRI